MTGDLLDRRLLFVTGKGGVGKTSVAAALADLAARSGLRTLVCEMDAKGALAATFDTTPLTFEPRQLDPRLFAMAMNTEDSLKEYLRLFVKVPLVGRIGPLARTFDFVADAAPGVKEILAVGKLAYEVRARHYDLVVVDAEASGHIVAQIGAPRVIRELVQVGMVREQTAWMTAILEDPATTGLVVVTTPEEMPVTETLDLLARLDRDAGVAPAAIVANRVLPALFDRRQADVVDRLSVSRASPRASERGSSVSRASPRASERGSSVSRASPRASERGSSVSRASPRATERGSSDVEQLLVDAAGPGVRQVLAAAHVTESRRRVGNRHLERLRAGIPSALPVLYVPELFIKATGRRVVSLVAKALAEELDVG